MAQPKDLLFNFLILMLSAVDALLLGSTWEGILITGAPGSGKSSCSGRQLAIGLLSVPRMGGLILTAKSEETQNWIRYAKECGRENDLIIFNAASEHCFDPLHYEWTRPGRGAGDLESIIDLFSTLVSMTNGKSGHTRDPFWERGVEQMMRNSIKLLDLANEPISIASIDRVIKSFPTRPGEHDEEAWQRESYCARLINSIRARQESLTADQWADLEVAAHFVFTKWPAFDERPRSSLEMTWSGTSEKFLFSPMTRLFCGGKCTITPEMTIHEGKIIICDFPLLEYGHETGRMVNVLMKLIFQRGWLRRDLSDSPNPVFLWQDEAQYFIVPKFDNYFQQTCRGSRVTNVLLTQNILNIAEILDEQQPGSKTKSLLGNLATKIFHQQNDTETMQYGSDQLGREYTYLDNYSGGSGGAGSQSHFSAGASRQLAAILEPITFQRLQKPDANNPLAEAIVYQSGRIFGASLTERNPKGSNYLSVFFSRE